MAVIFKSEEGRKSIISMYDLLLARWLVPFETHYLKTKYGETFVLSCGEKDSPPLVLLHGSSSNSAMWGGDIGALTQHFRVFAVDLPGEPGKSEAVRHELGSPAYAEWMRDVLTGLHIQKASFTGISLGGWMSLKFASIYPEMIEKLVLLCPAGIGPFKGTFLLLVLFCRLLGKKGFVKMYKKLGGKTGLTQETIDYSMLISKNFNPVMNVPLFSDEELKDVTVPTLIIAGDKDIMIDSAKTIDRAKRVLSDITAEMLPGEGHVLINQSERIIGFILGK